GGMGEVYLGEDPYIGRRVAIKIIKGADPTARDRFLHEARVIGGLTHPAIVSLLDFDFSSDEPFLVMEYLKGQGLDAWIQSPHSLTEQLRVLDDLCQALEYAHENGVLHRDVKPSNVQILPNGHAKLMDFGIARGAAGKLTATGSVMGTPEYMAPEILNDAAYSARSDLYGCAVLLYEMFTGSNPFAAKTVAAALTNVLTLNPQDIRTVHPGFPAHLAETLMACLRKEPELRPDGFGALIAAAREAGGGLSQGGIPETRAIPHSGVEAPALRAASEIQPSASSRKTSWAALGGLGVVVMVGLVWTLNRNPVPRAPAEGLMTTPTPPPAASATPSSIETEPVGRAAGPRARPDPAPRSTPVVRRESTSATPLVRPTVPITTATPDPPPAIPASSVAVAVNAPTPPPLATPSPTTTPPVSAPAEKAAPNPTLIGVSPRTVRRGSSWALDIEGRDLRRDLTASVLQGRRPAGGIRVVRQEFLSSALFRVTILIEPEVPLGAYTVVLRNASGIVTQGVQIEVVL
ncbi:MAG: protein kinase, partial [Vicinamibacteria bacterium]|nr:protein kinase [Vicinamibacteria bacterium]